MLASPFKGLEGGGILVGASLPLEGPASDVEKVDCRGSLLHRNARAPLDSLPFGGMRVTSTGSLPFKGRVGVGMGSGRNVVGRAAASV